MQIVHWEYEGKQASSVEPPRYDKKGMIRPLHRLYKRPEILKIFTPL